ncbi:Gloeo_Verruco repeat-containing protein [Soonwooa buanensis]|uniref:Gloeo_Verruco repeat-containing protein n=1 Tax=Soonwooa buanensis TaxID=619805 RepID=A0A1T5DW04_9FLAO|nr:choice-of-anchor tandem repeat GloVer-containing protein [Soonwooa buanensis]SKB75593.1 Gloeo_Verruco repeat-containing protein [Soonwooa buanensis]
MTKKLIIVISLCVLKILFGQGKILFGTTSLGGLYNAGTIFQYGLETGKFQKKADFNKTNGSMPTGTLVQVKNKLYGLTTEGGTKSFGVLYELNLSSNELTKKIDFVGANGTWPTGSLMKVSDTKLYGLTWPGGLYGMGTLFEYDVESGIMTKKHDFKANTDGGTRPSGSLTLANNGRIYGLTSSGGNYNNGTLFEYNIPNNIIVKLADFQRNITGATPEGDLLQASNGKLYGLTPIGGDNDFGTLFEFDTDTGVLTKKINFDQTIGSSIASLIEAKNGKLYGTTETGEHMILERFSNMILHKIQ